MHIESGDEFPSSTSGPERKEIIKSIQIYSTALSSPQKVPDVYCMGVWTCTTRDIAHKRSKNTSTYVRDRITAVHSFNTQFSYGQL